MFEQTWLSYKFSGFAKQILDSLNPSHSPKVLAVLLKDSFGSSV